MAIHIKECLPLLDTILAQQHVISERLDSLIKTFKREPEPIEPTLRTLLKPLDTSLREIREVATPQGTPKADKESGPGSMPPASE